MNEFVHPNLDETEREPRLVLRFALYAGAVLLVAGLAIAWLVNNEVASRAERTVESQGRAVVAANLNSHLRPADFAAPVSPARRRTLDQLFRRSIIIPGVVGGRLVSPNGTITYAANHVLIGARVQSSTDLQRVLDGSVQRRVAYTQTWRGQKHLKVLRVVVPVQLQGQSRAIGAVMLDQDYRAVAVSIGDARGKLALILTLALLALYISLFPILHRVTRQLEARNRRLREDAVERELLLENEQTARAEAESARQLLAAQNDRLRELDKLKDEFISLVSHELRTPLTSIRGYVELMQEDGQLNGDQRRYLGIVDRNSARLLDLVSDLLFLAQVDAGKLTFELRPVELDVIVAECIEASQPTALAKEIELVGEHGAAAGAAAGRPDAARPGARQPRLERAQVHAGGRQGRRAALGRRRRGAARGAGHGPRPRGGRAAPAVRALLPQLAGLGGCNPGDRPRPGDREGDRRAARRQDRARERGERRHDRAGQAAALPLGARPYPARARCLSGVPSPGLGISGPLIRFSHRTQPVNSPGPPIRRPWRASANPCAEDFPSDFSGG